MLHCGTVRVLLLGLCTTTSSFAFTHSPSLVKRTPTFLPISKLKSTSADTDTDTGTVENKKEIREVDAIIIGAGIGGLSCAALCAKYGLETLCLEAHDVPGGCAHAFDRYSSASTSTSTSTSTSNSNNQKIPFQFDSGPSLLSGMSSMGTNPLRQVLDAVGVTDCIDWKNYDGWIVHDYADDTKFKLTTGNGGEFEAAIEAKSGKTAREEFERFRDDMLSSRGLSECSAYIPPFALRGGGLSAIRSLSRYFLKLLSIGAKGTLLTGPFTQIMDKYKVTQDFNRKWFDYLAFALSGLDAAHTQAAPVVYTMSDLHTPGAVLDYPMGGMGSLANALVTGLNRHGGELQLNSRVDQLMLSDKDGKAHCSGVILADGTQIRARKGVVSNAPLWNMLKLMQNSVEGTFNKEDNPAVAEAIRKLKADADKMEMTGSFMHLHLGIPADGLPDDIECHHSVLNFNDDITDPQNLVIISIPTIFDPSLAPPGYHIVHAYTAASEDFSEWEPFLKDTDTVSASSPSSSSAQKYNRAPGYTELKEQKAEALWKAVECVIPDVRERVKQEGAISLVATPLTHQRYMLRHRGTYGPAPPKGKAVWELPGATTPIEGLLACGDTCFPGIGLPGVAASGTIAANTLVDVGKQMELMDELKQKGALQ